MPCGYVYSCLRLTAFREKAMNRVRLLHICVTPLVARSTKMVNVRASVSGTINSTDSHAFSL